MDDIRVIEEINASGPTGFYHVVRFDKHGPRDVIAGPYDSYYVADKRAQTERGERDSIWDIGPNM